MTDRETRSVKASKLRAVESRAQVAVAAVGENHHENACRGAAGNFASRVERGTRRVTDQQPLGAGQVVRQLVGGLRRHADLLVLDAWIVDAGDDRARNVLESLQTMQPVRRLGGDHPNGLVVSL